MLTPEKRRELIARIRSLPDDLETAVKDVPVSQLHTRYESDGWTIQQVVHHVSDSHMNAFVRTKLILTEDRPSLKGYNQEAWAELPDTTQPPIEYALLILRGLHARWVTLFESLPDSAWSRAGMHSESGEMTLEDILQTYSRHGQEHIEQIMRLRSKAQAQSGT